jgi:hypothetical protein
MRPTTLPSASTRFDPPDLVDLVHHIHLAATPGVTNGTAATREEAMAKFRGGVGERESVLVMRKAPGPDAGAQGGPGSGLSSFLLSHAYARKGRRGVGLGIPRTSQKPISAPRSSVPSSR